ncbi:MAG TPA: pantoate--beta-alanine ligase [Candidatus Latescibacteria bacterium]|nr:pantoate--beta-alanine ligase [Candidatus Handelsmanbacteria bacterium]HIL07453.1 pantoate--beta-alanine ligase [Candidatus Latescibacterota bacterium]
MSKPQLINTVAKMQAQSDTWRGEGLRIGLVPTMGFLHEGHLSLVDYSLSAADRTIVSIFVNPLQFGPKEDFAIYPRDIERDIKLLAQRGVDAVFKPQTVEFYPPDFSTTVEVTHLADGLCGAMRPGHFRGVTTVVSKLFTATKPHLAIFGQKDYQQAAVIRRLVRDLNLDLHIEVAPTMREADGLAMSSRNVNLTEDERRRVPALYQALAMAKRYIECGERDTQRIIGEMRSQIEKELGGDIEYISIVHPDTLEDLSEIAGPVVIALAVRLANVRLIDNISAEPSRK